MWIGIIEYFINTNDVNRILDVFDQKHCVEFLLDIDMNQACVMRSFQKTTRNFCESSSSGAGSVSALLRNENPVPRAFEDSPVLEYSSGLYRPISAYDTLVTINSNNKNTDALRTRVLEAWRNKKGWTESIKESEAEVAIYFSEERVENKQFLELLLQSFARIGLSGKTIKITFRPGLEATQSNELNKVITDAGYIAKDLSASASRSRSPLMRP